MQVHYDPGADGRGHCDYCLYFGGCSEVQNIWAIDAQIFIWESDKTPECKYSETPLPTTLVVLIMGQAEVTGGLL
jgi:hypothetical protein